MMYGPVYNCRFEIFYYYLMVRGYFKRSFFYSATLRVCVNDCSNKLAISSYCFFCFASGLNLYDCQLFIHVQFHVRIMKLAYVCS